MAKKTGLGPVKRFGARYGRTVKHRRAKVEYEQQADHKCPYCSRTRLSRDAFGIWICRKCGSKFTAKAYTVGKPVSYVEDHVELSADFPEEKSKKVEVEEAEA